MKNTLIYIIIMVVFGLNIYSDEVKNLKFKTFRYNIDEIKPLPFLKEKAPDRLESLTVECPWMYACAFEIKSSSLYLHQIYIGLGGGLDKNNYKFRVTEEIVENFEKHYSIGYIFHFLTVLKFKFDPGLKIDYYTVWKGIDLNKIISQHTWGDLRSSTRIERKDNYLISYSLKINKKIRKLFPQKIRVLNFHRWNNNVFLLLSQPSWFEEESQVKEPTDINSEYGYGSMHRDDYVEYLINSRLYLALVQIKDGVPELVSLKAELDYSMDAGHRRDNIENLYEHEINGHRVISFTSFYSEENAGWWNPRTKLHLVWLGKY